MDGKTDMLQFVDGVLTKMLSDGRWEKLYDQYLGKVEGLPKPAEAKTRKASTIAIGTSSVFILNVLEATVKVIGSDI